MAKVNAIFLIFPIGKAAGQRKKRYTDPSLPLDRLVKGGAVKGGEEFLMPPSLLRGHSLFQAKQARSALAERA